MRLYTDVKLAAASAAVSFGQMQWSWRRDGEPPSAKQIEKGYKALKERLEERIREGGDLVSISRNGLCVSRTIEEDPAAGTFIYSLDIGSMAKQIASAIP